MFVNLPTFIMKLNLTANAKSDDYCEQPQAIRDKTGDESFLAILGLSFLFMAVFNARYFGLSSVIVLKGYNWFTTAIITAAVVVYHFPVALLNLVFVFPLLHNCVPLFYFSKHKQFEKISISQWILSNAMFLLATAASIVFLASPLLMKDMKKTEV